MLAAASFGQNGSDLFERAPAGIDEALRARVTQFYQSHVDGKFRAADELVAEDSKDAFFMADKSRYRGFQIMKISYSDDFTRATVAVACDTELVMPAGVFPVKMPVSSKWKVVDGQWMWYTVPPEKGLATPIGVNISPSKEQAAAPARTPPPLAAAVGPMDLESVSRMIRVDRQQVTFNPSAAGEQRVVVTSSMPGSVSLTLEPAKLEGFELSFDRTRLEQGQSATLLIRYQPSPDLKPAAATVNVVVAPILKTIPVQIRFSASSPASR
jgi:hypothetical protein